MTDPRGSLGQLVSIEGGHIRPFDGFIFLCGGEMNAEEHRPVSVRDALCREFAKHPHLESRVRLAENYKDWSSEGHYNDLLTFENHIAELSAVIVLILESPGSLAELGLFSALESFRHKLVVFVSTYHYDQPSFIRLGPVQFLESTLKNEAEIFPWIKNDYGRPSLDVDELARIQTELFEALKDRIPAVPTETQFNRESWLHRTLLVCELVWLMNALTITEIQKYSLELGVDISLVELRQTLFILERLEMIAMEARSNQRFYISRLDRSLIKWRPAETLFDASRFQMETARFYEDADKKRFRAIQQSRRNRR